MRLACTFVTLALLSACGGSGSQPPPAQPQPNTAPAPAPAKTASAEPAPTGAAKDASRKDEHHKAFLKGCLANAPEANDYCECAWTATSSALTDEELDAPGQDPKKIVAARAEISAKCGGKAPESLVRDSYINGCTGDRVEMKGYCDCTWTEFRKRFSAQELGDESIVKQEKFLASRAPVVKTCGAKMPEPVAKDSFMRGCAQDPAADQFCGCAWKEIRKLGSPAEVEAGLVDPEKMRANVDTACAKFRPTAGAKKK